MEKAREPGAGVSKGVVFVGVDKEKTGWGTTVLTKYLHWQKRKAVLPEERASVWCP